MSNQKPSLRFEIENFSEQDNIIASDTFVSGGCEWYIFVGPNGDCAADSHLSLSLQLEDSTPLRAGHLQARNMACGWNSEGWIYEKTLPLSKFQEKGFLEKDKLIIEFYIQVVSNKKNKNKTVDINGFQVLASQVTKVRKIFTAHPDIALDFKPTIQEVKTAYMNVLLRVIKTLHKPPKSLSETRLSKASSELSELMKSNLDDLSWKKSYDVIFFKEIEDRVMGIEFKLESLNTKLEEISKENKKADDADGSLVQQLEESVKNIELMVSHLKVELEKKKNISSADGFLLVD
ncbi:hypothetical protein Bca52824_049900 [Brassica carinata]|uniref:MATH domain-containing protein n=1 Tax=Brassica carinata TaxID=52824 RepID=A0A8X7UUK9_BRACI|nr:hypothetical protein Bca52824_049900 [Brassica carinata]